MLLISDVKLYRMPQTDQVKTSYMVELHHLRVDDVIMSVDSIILVLFRKKIKFPSSQSLKLKR